MSTAVNFDQLVNNARNGEIEHLNTLYRSFLELESWVFVARPRPDMENAQPFVGMINDRLWLFVFTDSARADAFCRRTSDFTDADGKSYFINIPVNASLEMMYHLSNQNVYGIRVNDGENGWFCPLSDIPNIIRFLETEKK